MSDSLREALSSALDAAETTTEPVETTTEVVAEPPQAETAAQAEQRQRDEKGRFAPKESVAQAPEPVKAETVNPTLSPVAAESLKPPSSWKKDYWDAFGKLDPNVAKYIQEREQQFANGVSTYRQEAERAKELWSAIAPFQPVLQQHGIQPGQWISQLGQAHMQLVQGSPQQKLAMFQKLAQDYGVSLESVQSGQVGPVEQYLSPLQEQIRQLQGQFSSYQQQIQQQEQAATMQQIEAFKANAEHFDTVRETMAGLLHAGLANDLQSAYDKAIRMNDELFAQAQQAKAADAEKQRHEAEQARVNKARANAVSVKGSTPLGTTVTKANPGLRSMLEEQVESVLGGARV